MLLAGGFKAIFSDPSRVSTLLVFWLFILTSSGLYLFTSGFLLSRLSLTNVNECDDCTLPATHSRAILLIIDALRFDFISEHPPIPSNDAYHHVLTLPQQLSASRPQHSFIFNAHSDPPTATMQRIKGLTTGSLPTFVDVSSNFGATSIEEDSLLSRFKGAGKKVTHTTSLTGLVTQGSPGCFRGRRHMDKPLQGFDRPFHVLPIRFIQC